MSTNLVRVVFGVFALALSAAAGTLTGHVRDQNWYARYQSNPFGVGYYEFAVNANAANDSSVAGGGFAATDVFGLFSMPNLNAGSCTVASWDVWWRSAYAFNVPVPASGSSADVDLRLQATMWGYAAFWDDTSHYEFGQTFVASGPISMIFLRDPLNTAFTRTVTVHAGGPGGAQVGSTRTYGNGGDQRLIYGYNAMPTVRGQTYYLRIRTPSPATGAVLMQMDPRPDFSDPMPGGCLYLGDGTTLTAYPDRDLGVVIMSDDDGLLTNLYARQSGSQNFSGTNVGQTFIARGVSLVSAAFWLADPAAYTYAVRVFQNGPGGAPVGATKRNKPGRLGADPEMLVCWAPGECPLTPGQTYYLEVSRDTGGTFTSAYTHAFNPYPYGQAHQNGIAMSGIDLAGTIMEEESAGSATRPAVKFTTEPAVTEANRGTDSLTVTWATDVAADSLVEYAATAPPYIASNAAAALVTSHSLTLTGLQANTMYHFRAASAQAGYRTAISRDLVICTKPALPNLLANSGFELGSGASPRPVIPGWTKGGSLDIQMSDGTWFSGLPPRSGSWLLQGALNGSSSDATIHQRVSDVTPGKDYTFSAWVTTWPRENNTWKYDVWQARSRLIYMRLGIDPTGGTNPAAAKVQWTPRMYSHLRWNNFVTTATAQSTGITVFVSMKGDGVQWHLYGVDDTVLTETPPVTPPPTPTLIQALTVAASNTITLTLSAYANLATATNPANYLILLDGTNALTVLNATLVNGTNVLLTTSPQTPRRDYVVVVSSIVHVASEPGPNVSNGQLAVRVALPLISIDAGTLWKFNQTGANLGVGWRTLAFNDGAWTSGPALLADETAVLPEPIRTSLSANTNTITFYFRHRFIVPAGVTNPPLRLRHVVDDGAVFYLNNAELYRVGMTNPIAFNTLAQRLVSDAVYEGPFPLTPTNLQPGTNVLAVEVHQSAASSSDVVFGASLDALVAPSQMPPPDRTLTIARQGDNVVLTWPTPLLTLETAPALLGPWSSLPGAASPTVVPTADPARFFRLQE